MHLLIHFAEHALEDTLALVPFLFATYLVLETLERTAGDRVNLAVRRAGKAGPVVGALLGVVPQCGFSAMAATLYAGRVVTLGTLAAVFLSTSDEMLPMLVAERVDASLLIKVLGAKVLIALVTGVLADMAIRALRRNARVHALLRKTVLSVQRDGVETDVVNQMAEGGEGAERICRLCEQDHCGCGHDHGHGGARAHACDSDRDLDRAHDGASGYFADFEHGCDHGHEHGRGRGGESSECHDGGYGRCHDPHQGHDCEHARERDICQDHDCEHGHRHDSHHGHDHGAERGISGELGSIVRSAVSHTVQVGLFIFLVTFALEAVLETVGEGALAAFLSGNELLAVFASALVGLVPNCSASVVITQLYLEGVLGFAPLMAGLLTSAGVGYLVLLRTNRHPRENTVIVAGLFVVACLWGLVFSAFGL